jgi:hypothetical protein
MIKKWICIVVVACGFWSCEKESGSNCGAPPTVPVISWDEPVTEGQDLVLRARGNGEHNYKWEGPDNFTATGQVVEIESVQVEQTGTYTASVSLGNCSPVFNSAYLEVEPLPLPCELPENQLEIQSKAALVASSIACDLDNQEGNYTFSAIFGDSGQEIEVIVRFGHSEAPAYAKSYTLQNLNKNVHEAAVELIRGDTSFTAFSSRVYVRRTSTGFTTHLCNMPFRSTLDGNSIVVASAMIRCYY